MLHTLKIHNRGIHGFVLFRYIFTTCNTVTLYVGKEATSAYSPSSRIETTLVRRALVQARHPRIGLAGAWPAAATKQRAFLTRRRRAFVATAASSAWRHVEARRGLVCSDWSCSVVGRRPAPRMRRRAGARGPPRRPAEGRKPSPCSPPGGACAAGRLRTCAPRGQACRAPV
jgi:hypothetical protein